MESPDEIKEGMVFALETYCVTLGGAGILYGIGAWWSDNLVVSFRRPHDAEWLGTGSFLGLPSITLAFILMAVIAELVRRHTNFGRKVYLS